MVRLICEDRRVFDPGAVSAETRKFNSHVEKMLAKLPPKHTRRPEELREGTESGKDWMGPYKRLQEAKDRVVSASGRSVTVRIVIPPDPKGVYLHTHGGGFVLMRPFHFDELLVATANNSKLAVVSVDYRLAPEDPYPAAADDCETAALWLIKNAQKEFSTTRLLIGGESAGANLAAVTLVRMREKHRFSGFSGANLVFGCFDLSMTPSQRNWGEDSRLLSTRDIEWFTGHYIPNPEMRRNHDCSPLYADLSRMPPALFTVGTRDPFLDDTLFMHARWIAAGNHSDLAIYAGCTHMFTSFPIDIAKEANRRIFKFLSGTAHSTLSPAKKSGRR